MFKVGDFVTIKENTALCQHIGIGQIIKIVDDRIAPYPYNVKSITWEYAAWLSAKELKLHKVSPLERAVWSIDGT